LSEKGDYGCSWKRRAYEVAGEATDSQEAIDLIARLLPELHAGVAIAAGGLDVLADNTLGSAPDSRAVLTGLSMSAERSRHLRITRARLPAQDPASDYVIAAVNHVHRGECI